jgi:hypothetical protein
LLRFTSVPVCRRDLPFDANMLELDGRSPTDSQPYLGMGTIVVKETICVTARAQRHFRHRDTMSRRKKISPRRHGEHQDLQGRGRLVGAVVRVFARFEIRRRFVAVA